MSKVDLKNIIILILIGVVIYLFIADIQQKKEKQRAGGAEEVGVPVAVAPHVVNDLPVPPEGTDAQPAEEPPIVFAPGEEYLVLTLLRGDTVKGRVSSKTSSGDYIMQIPGSRVTVVKEEIVEKKRLTGQAALDLKKEIDQTPALQIEDTGAKKPVAHGGSSGWGYNLPDAIKKAEAAQKFVIVDFYTTWCGWCKELDKKTFHNREVQSILRKHFVCVKIDGDRHPDLVQQYRVNAYPTVVFLNGRGTVLYTHRGYSPPDAFVGILNDIVRRKR